MGVGVVMIEVVSHRFGHLPRYLCAAGAIEISDGKTIVNSLECWKKRSDLGSGQQCCGPRLNGSDENFEATDYAGRPDYSKHAWEMTLHSLFLNVDV